MTRGQSNRLQCIQVQLLFRQGNGKSLHHTLVKVVDDWTGGGVQLPLHQAVLWPQLQHFVPVKYVEQVCPDGVSVTLEDDGELKGRRDTRVREDTPHALQVVFTLHVQCYRCTPEAARLVGGGAHHVVAHLGGHVTRKQQQLAVEERSFSLCQAVFDLPGDIQLEKSLFLFQLHVNC